MKFSAQVLKLSRRSRAGVSEKWHAVLPVSIALALAAAVLLPAHAAQQLSANDASTQAQIFTWKSIDGQFAKILEQSKHTDGGGGSLGSYGSHSIILSYRRASGNAEVHAHFDDIIFIRSGKAVLCTGGTVVNGKTSPDGETKGSSIAGGVRQTVVTGDIIHIPAGTPHQFFVQPGGSYSAVVVKVRE